jgi:SAM-dependent methyltransferase
MAGNPLKALANSGQQAKVDPYRLSEGILYPPVAVAHRDEEYDTLGFDVIRKMQAEHFWYRGRHRFLLHAVHHYLADATRPRRWIDLGGGCGGWVAYLMERARIPLAEVALADSSVSALRMAHEHLPPGVALYQIDLLNLHWEHRWDVAFLLDVMEHIPEDEKALRQVYEALAPGGYAFVTTPALRQFWSWNDEVCGHQRRYSRADYAALATRCGFRLVDARYFMFALSPLYLASRLSRRPPLEQMSREEIWQLMAKTHRVPHPVINAALASVFACETPLGHWVPFPWGTSVLGVFQKPL